MRHRKSGRKFSRTPSHRRLMLLNLAKSVIDHGLIKTSLPKAKELRGVLEPLITLAKKDSVHSRRLAFAKLSDDRIVAKLFKEIGPKNVNRPGGYLRIIKCGFRKGDSAPMAIVELTERSLPESNQQQA